MHNRDTRSEIVRGIKGNLNTPHPDKDYWQTTNSTWILNLRLGVRLPAQQTALSCMTPFSFQLNALDFKTCNLGFQIAVFYFKEPEAVLDANATNTTNTAN